MPTRLTRTVLGAAGIALAALTGCGAPGGGSPDRPCGGTPAATTELGLSEVVSPTAANGWEPASFTTTGGTLYLHPHDFGPDSGSNLFRRSKGSQVNSFIGTADAPPVTDDKGNVSPVQVQVDAGEGRYRPFDLPAGRYWLMTNPPVRIELLSCTPHTLIGTPRTPGKPGATTDRPTSPSRRHPTTRPT